MLDIILGILLCIAVVFGISCNSKLRIVKSQLRNMSDILNDIHRGNGNRKILAVDNELTSDIAYKMNEIIYNYEEQLSALRVEDEANRQLMTSLSHDVRTPLTTLIGYLDAIQKGNVTGKEREEYFEIARRKAHDLKEYIDILFDWFKLNSSEFEISLEKTELTELMRNILKDWIPIFEENQLEYEIEIPTEAIFSNVDLDGYSRAINNLIQNVIAHSQAKNIKINMTNNEGKVKIEIIDDGIGIDKTDLKHIFERLYKCDKGRSYKGSGMGLSITRQLIEKMGGMITVQSELKKYTAFTILFPALN